jgi:hypothetical protein
MGLDFDKQHLPTIEAKLSAIRLVNIPCNEKGTACYLVVYLEKWPI